VSPRTLARLKGRLLGLALLGLLLACLFLPYYYLRLLL